jgi:uncharacterized protein YkwD
LHQSTTKNTNMTLTKPKPKRSTNSHRKRSGQHHTHGHHYAKAYWPYLPVFAVLGLGVLLNSWLGQVNHSVLGYATDVSSTTLLAETNAERLENQLQALRINSQLTQAAQSKADDMARQNYWSHVSPNGEQPWSFIAASGYTYQVAGENLAYGFGSSQQVVNAWMHSTDHRANMLHSGYQDVGFASVNIADFRGQGPQTVIVALYGEPASATPANATVHLGEGTASVSRIELISSATWTQLALAALCGAALMLFFVRHSIAWHKVLVRGEQFVVKHPLLDIVLVSTVVVTLTLAHAVGAVL